jgi:hypothetical protein
VDSLGLFGHMEKRTVLSAVRFFWLLEDWTGFEFPSISCVHVYSLLDGFRVRENFLRARLLSFGQVSGSRELLACTFTLY